MAAILQYNPLARPTGTEAIAHPFFDELRNPDTRMHTGNSLPPCFNFTLEELSIQPELAEKLVPPHCYEELRPHGIDMDHFTPVSPPNGYFMSID
jgi:glycogen synthase kinase 3 beta